MIVIVLDGCGVGAMPDAARFGPTDAVSATLPHVGAAGGLSLPTLGLLGLGRVARIDGVSEDGAALGAYGRMAERSEGKDSVTGHWEMMGVVTKTAFPTYPHGFPSDVIAAFESAIGRKTLGNVPASGTEIIREFGEEHVRTGKPIVYTSADSVFQIAAHEAVVPLDELYRMCEIAREQLVAPDNVQRVIARPFTGESSGTFTRTANRKDFPFATPEPNVLSALRAAGKRIHAIGVVAELFPAHLFTSAERTQSNAQHLAAIKNAVVRDDFDFLFANCEDFDMLFGHRNDPVGFAKALEVFDVALAEILTLLKPTDLLILTADHGNDPTTPSTDHSREYVPVLAYGRGAEAGRDVGTRSTFADVGATVAASLGVIWTGAGQSIL